MHDKHIQTSPEHAMNLFARKAKEPDAFTPPSGFEQNLNNKPRATAWQTSRPYAQPEKQEGNEISLGGFSAKKQTKYPAHSPDAGSAKKDLVRNKSLEKLEKKSQTSSRAIMITDDQGIITYVNPAFERITGYLQSEAAGKPASLLKSGLHEHGFYTDLWERLRAGREFQGVFANRRKNGEFYFEEKRIRPFIEHGKTSYFVAVGHPLSEHLQGTMLRLSQLANNDPLTGLPNRNLFLDRLHQHLSRASRYGARFTLAYLDLDNFKTINDTLGHHAGDIALKATARHIQDSLRDEDTVGRLGGDEFGLILSNTHDENDVRRTLEKV